MGMGGLILTVNMIVVSLLLFSAASVLSQITPPVFNKIGCPKPETWPFKGENNCFVGSTACIRDRGYIKDNPKPLVDIGDLRRNNNVYRIIRTRSWWFCGKACDPTTPCKYWTYRRHETLLPPEELLRDPGPGLHQRHKQVPRILKRIWKC